MNMTIKDIARMANVSVATVSRVLNNRPGISAERRKAIMDLVDQVGYMPNQSAQNLVHQRSHMVGFIASDLRNRAYVDVVQTIEAGCRARGYRVLIADSEGRLDAERENINDMLRYRAEGLLIFPLSDIDDRAGFDHLMTLKLRKVPFVTLGGNTGSAFDRLVLDEQEGGYTVAKHLIGLGHRRLAVVGIPQTSNPSAEERRHGIMQAMAESGLTGSSPEAPMLRQTTDDGAGNFIPRVLEWMGDDEPPTAIIAINPTVLLRLIRPLNQRGIRVPDEVSLICFGQEGWCPNLYPSISTAYVDNRRRARQAFDMLFRRMDDPEHPVMAETIHYTLMERESTAPPPA